MAVRNIGSRWTKVAKLLHGRRSGSCRMRWTKHLDPSIKKGNWTIEEDNIVLAGVAKYGRSWVTIGQQLPGRCEADILSRYLSLSQAQNVCENWSEDEDTLLRTAIERHGTRNWNLVADVVQRRGATACMKRWSFLDKSKATFSEVWSEAVSCVRCLICSPG